MSIKTRLYNAGAVLFTFFLLFMLMFGILVQLSTFIRNILTTFIGHRVLLSTILSILSIGISFTASLLLIKPVGKYLFIGYKNVTWFSSNEETINEDETQEDSLEY